MSSVASLMTNTVKDQIFMKGLPHTLCAIPVFNLVFPKQSDALCCMIDIPCLVSRRQHDLREIGARMKGLAFREHDSRTNIIIVNFRET